MTEGTVDFCEIFGRRPKVAIGHPMLGRGGSEGSMMWLIEALKADCDIALLTTRGWQLDEMNEFYGTGVQAHEVRLRHIPTPLLDRVSAAALRGALFQRFLRKAAPEYDLRIGAYNPTDWGAPAIHYIADFSWHSIIRHRYDPPSPGLAYRDTFLRRLYLGLCEMCEQPSGRDFLGRDTIVANSHWSAEQMRQYRDGQLVPVVYPPVWGRFPEVAWDAKKLSFAMIGRIAPEKRIERAIEVLSAVRARGYNLQLHLCGKIEDDRYGQMIKVLCDANRGWVIAEGLVTGARKTALLANCRYGIQMRSAEPFGISVAEMVKAGAVVFAPHLGGQAEILDHACLQFDAETEAVEKIDAVLRSVELQLRLRTHLRSRAKEFSAEKFMAQSREIIGRHAKTAMGVELA